MLSQQPIINFNCLGNGCPNHCCGAYGAISEKLHSLSGVQFSEIVLTDSDVKKLRKSGQEEFIYKGDDGISRIKTHKDGTCYALKNGICSIYDVRPSVCIAYPLYLDMFAGLCFLNECPVFSPELTMNDYKVALSSLLDIYQHWINLYRNKLDNLE